MDRIRARRRSKWLIACGGLVFVLGLFLYLSYLPFCNLPMPQNEGPYSACSGISNIPPTYPDLAMTLLGLLLLGTGCYFWRAASLRGNSIQDDDPLD